jgi:pilus assembly protein CpaF
VLMAGTDLPSRAIQKQIASAIDVVVQAERMRGGGRKIVSIAEVTGLEDGEPRYQEIFQFRQTGVDDEGRATGYHTAVGHRSVHLQHFDERGEHVSDAMFEAVPPPTVLADGLGGSAS